MLWAQGEEQADMATIYHTYVIFVNIFNEMEYFPGCMMTILHMSAIQGKHCCIYRVFPGLTLCSMTLA
jgi:hypothetical protein